MKNFNKRENEIIRRAYADAARICWEREWEAHNNQYSDFSPEWMAKYLKELMPVRAMQILKYKCDLPKPRKLTKVRKYKGCP